MVIELDDKSALAVGGEDRVRDDTPHVDGVDYLHIGTLDRQHADGLVGTVGNEREVARGVEAQAGWLLTDGQRAGSLGGSALRSMT